MPADRWLVVSIETPSADLRELVASELVALTGNPVIEEPGGATTCVPASEDPGATVAEIREQLASVLPDAAALPITWRWQADEDWDREWKRGLQPREVSRRVVVKPSWTHFDPAPHQIVVEIDPQMAFGTGEHPTTRACLRLLDAALQRHDRVLDVGSGSGILAIAAALLGASEVIAVEHDPDANVNARENLERHAVLGKVTLLERMADDRLLGRMDRFDLIMANILSGVIRPLLPAFHRALDGAPTGRLIVSGILSQERDVLLTAAREAGFGLSAEDVEEEWWSALLVPNGAAAAIGPPSVD